MLTVRTPYDLESTLDRVLFAIEVFPVPTGPTNNTGLNDLIKDDTRNWYRTVSTVGTINRKKGVLKY